MKKFLITIFALGYILNVAAATYGDLKLQGFEYKPLNQDRKKLIKKQPVLTRAEDNSGYWFGYCYDIYTAFGMGANYMGAMLEGVIEIPEEVAQDWKGAKVTAINVGFGKSSDHKINLYITKDLEGVPVMMQETEVENELGWNEVALDTPYTIDGSRFFVGYQTMQAQGDDYPWAVDGIPTDAEYGGIVGVTYPDESGEPVTVYDVINYMYGNICLRIKLEGSNLPKYSFIGEGLYMATKAQINDPFQVVVGIINTGLEGIAGADVTCKINGKAATGYTVSILGEASIDPDAAEKDETQANNLIPFGSTGFVVIDGLKSDTEGVNNIDITINSVSGKDGTSGGEALQTSTTILILDNPFPKTIVMEEFTGTWCQACPAGIVGMDYMEETYGSDKYIGIVAHYGPASSSSYDPMYTASYWDIIRDFSGGQFPSGVMDRSVSVYPDKESLVEAYESLYKYAEAKVDLEASYDRELNVIQAKSTSTFGFSGTNQTYAVAFVITENNVGPYIQTNGYAGSKVPMGGWENMGTSVPWHFDHVARDIFFAYGIEESVINTIEEGKGYDFNISLPLDNVTNVTNTDVIVLLLNYSTGEIVNAAKLKMSEQAGVESIIAEPEDGVYKVYNLQGVKLLETKDSSSLNGFAKGIYIINGKKVVI